MKVAICAIAKLENNYIKEWYDHHSSIGIDTFFVYDNNDIDGESISDVLNGDNVQVINYRGQRKNQTLAYTECYNTHKNEYDWFVFIDIDEFIILEDKYNNDIKQFLSESMFNGFDTIKLRWKVYSDNNLLDVVNDNYSITRFTKPVLATAKRYRHNKNCKAIIRGNIQKNIQIDAHGCYSLVKACNSEGIKCLNDNELIDNGEIRYVNAWINHYRTKTIGEWIKIKAARKNNSWSTIECCSLQNPNLDFFFSFNEYSNEKLEYARKLLSQLQ